MVIKIKSAIKADPLEGFYYYKLGTLKWYLGEKDEALRNHALAGYLNPMEGVFLQQLGLLSGDDERSKALIEYGFKRAVKKEDLALSYAEWLFWKQRRREGLAVVEERLQDNFTAIKFWMPLLNAYDVTSKEHEQILPESTAAWLNFGRYCELNRSLEEADYFYSGAMSFLVDGEEIDPYWYLDVIHYFKRQDQKDMALLYIRQAINRVPDYPEFHILLGDYYRLKGITYRAKEEYEQALVLDPASREARSNLRKMGFEDAY